MHIKTIVMNKILFWTPRVLTIIFILFISLFALDSFEGDHSLLAKLAAFLIHLIPSFVLVLLLIIAWKREWIGAIGFLLLGLAYIGMFWHRFPASTYAIISGPLFLVSLLFWLNWKAKKEK